MDHFSKLASNASYGQLVDEDLAPAYLKANEHSHQLAVMLNDLTPEELEIISTPAVREAFIKAFIRKENSN